MSQIRLKDTTTGALDNYPVLWIDIDKLQGFDPSLPLSQSTTDCAGAVQYATATYGATVDLDYYVLGDSVSGGYTSGYLDACISGATKPDDRVSRRLVDFVRQSDGGTPDAGYPFNMLFQSASYTTPPADFNGTSYFSKQSYGGYTKYNIINTFSPGAYSKNEYISRKFVTTTGNTFGVCIGVGGSDNREFVCSGAGTIVGGSEHDQYLNVTDPRYGSGCGLSPAVQDNRDVYGSGGWMRYTDAGGGSAVPYFNTNPFAQSAADPYSTSGGTLTEPVILRQVSVQMAAAKINNKMYMGVACIRWNLDSIAQIYVELFPAWFWGDAQIDPAADDPADIPQYWGYDSKPNRTSGTYNITYNDIDLPTAVQPFSGVSTTGYGLHVYAITTAQYEELQENLWGDGSIAKSLWNRWTNFKYNPIAAVVGCHKIPDAFEPTTGTTSRVHGAGSMMTDTSVLCVNAKTTVDSPKYTIDMPKYFTSFLNWNPYTSIMMFLPFCGWLDIPADRCIDTDPETGTAGIISLQYRCDIITGNVVAFVRCFDGAGHNTASYQMTGNCAMSVPVTGNDNGVGTVIGAITAGVGVAAAAIATGGAGAGLVAGAASAGIGTHLGRNVMQTGATYSGNIAMIGCLQPFILVTMPIESTSEQFRQLHGIQSSNGVAVSDLVGTGYTEFSQFHADIDCTKEEQDEIEQIMKTGVIL